MWRLELGDAKFFVNRDITFDETRMTMMCRYPDKGKEKIHVEVEPSSDGSNHLEVLDDEA